MPDDRSGMTPGKGPGRLMKLEDVEHETSLSRWTIRRRIRAGTFPQGHSLGGNRVAWAESEIENWKAQMLAAHPA